MAITFLFVKGGLLRTHHRLVLCFLVFSGVTGASAVLVSPNGELLLDLEVSGDGQLQYTVERGGQAYLEASSFGFSIDGIDLSHSVTGYALTGNQSVDFDYLTRGDRQIARNHYNQFTLEVSRSGIDLPTYTIEVRIYNEGVAFRYGIPGYGVRVINSESSTWGIPNNAKVWYQSGPSSEGLWLVSDASLINSVVDGPLTVELENDGGFVHLSEAALSGYPSMSYQFEAGENVIRSVFPSDVDWQKDGGDYSPWRVILAVENLADLVSTDLFTSLTPTARHIAYPGGFESPWLKPGKALWSEWSDPTSAGDYTTQEYFIREADRLGFEYVLVGDDWQTGFFEGEVNSFDRLAQLVDYGRADGRDVGIWISLKYTSDLDLDGWNNLLFAARFSGAVGVKVDFGDLPDRDSAFRNNELEEIAATAGSFELMLTFHGVPNFHGISRSYPNVMNWEGVRGLEYSRFEGAELSPEHNAVLAYTRFVSGPADYTPVTLTESHMGSTTFAHQIAMAGIVTSPFLTIAESPLILQGHPLVEEVLTRLPTDWEETILLEGSEIGKLAIKARRSGDDWYLFCINGDSLAEKNFDLSLSFLGDAVYDLDLYSDATQFSLQRSERFNLIKSDFERLSLLPGGGCVAVFTKRQSQNRSFRLGFGTFPLSGDESGIGRVYGDIERNGDLIRHSFNDGIPWVEAAGGPDVQNFPASLLTHWEYLRSRDYTELPGHAVYIATSPFDTDTYAGLAPAWGVGPNEALPTPWDEFSFNSNEVKEAYVNYLIALVLYFDPDYIAIGEDANLVLTYSPENWDAYVELNAYAYSQLKVFYPELPIFASIQYEHMLAINTDAAATASAYAEIYPNMLELEVESLMEHSDLLAFSLYPYKYEGVDVFGGDYFQSLYDVARRVNLPIAIDQTGYISEDYTLPGGAVIAGSEALQYDYLEMLLRAAFDRQFYFVVNGVVRDYTPGLYPEAPAEIAGTGLVRDTGDLKAAESVWSDYVDLPHLNMEEDRYTQDSDGDGVNDFQDSSPNDPLVSSLHVFFNDGDGDQFGDDAQPFVVADLVPQVPLVVWGGDTSDYSKLAVPDITYRGGRVIGFDFWDVEPTTYAEDVLFRELGAEVVTLHLDWGEMEAAGGLFTGAGVDRLRQAIAVCEASDLKLCLSLNPIHGSELVLPGDLSSSFLSNTLTWNSPELLFRFNLLLDFVFQEMGEVELDSLLIGSDLDQCQLGSAVVDFWENYRLFLDSAATHVNNLWGSDLKRGVTVSVRGLSEISGESAAFRELLNFGDFIGLSLSYIESNFSVMEPTGLSTYLGAILDEFPEEEFRFVSVCFPSSPHTFSSTTKQSQFWMGFFEFWDEYIDQVPFASLGGIVDSSDSVANELAASYFGDPERIRDYFASTGLLTSAGEKKSAFHTLRDLSFNRGWWVIPDLKSRSYNMGFTSFPYDDPEDENEFFAMQDWMNDHLYESSDIINLQFDGGIPWVEALADDMVGDVAPYPDYILDFWAELKEGVPEGHKVIAAFSPTGLPRSRLNAYWGLSREIYIVDDVGLITRPEGEEEVRLKGFLPEPWDKYRFNDPQVKEALTKYAKRMIQYFEPDYLLVGLEASESIPEDVQRFYEYIELQQHLYTELKADPETSNVPIIVSISSTSLMKDEFGVPLKFEQQPYGEFQAQVDGLKALLPYVDILGLSHYPHFGKNNAFKISSSMYEQFFEVLDAAGASDMPIAITESGYTADPYIVIDTPFTGSPEKQNLYFKHMFYELEKASNPIEFVINYEVRDTDFAWFRDYQRAQDGELNPLLVEFLQYFRDIGLYDGDGGDGRPALATWTNQLNRPILSKSLAASYPRTFSDWMTRFTVDQTLNGALDNPDFDQYINLLEYALAGDPLTHTAGAAISFSEFGQGDGYKWVKFQFRRSVFASDVEISFQQSSDLVEWRPLGFDEANVAQEVLYWIEEEHSYVEVVEVTIAIVGDDVPLFLRLGVEE